MNTLSAFRIFLCGLFTLLGGALPAQGQTATPFAPGYAVTKGVGLSVNVAPGAAFCGGALVRYPGGTLSLRASATSYVYLNTGVNCTPAVRSSSLSGRDIPLAMLATSATAVVSLTDVRTMFRYDPLAYAAPVVQPVIQGLPGTSTGWALTFQGNCPDTNNCMTYNGGFGAPPTPQGTGSQAYFLENNLVCLGEGSNLGNPPGVSPGRGGWSGCAIHTGSVWFLRRGISQYHGLNLFCHRPADCAFEYPYIYSTGSNADASGEGNTIWSGKMIEEPTPWHATVACAAAACGAGPLNPTWSASSGTPGGDQTALIDITQGRLALSITGDTAIPGSFGHIFTTSGGLPLTAAWGTATSGIDDPRVPANKTASVTLTVNLGAIGALRPAFSVGPACISGPTYPQWTTVTDTHGYAGGAVETVTLNVRYPNGGAFMPVIYQGGVACQRISLDADLADSGQRTSFIAFGSLTGADLIYGEWYGGGVSGGIGNHIETLTPPGNGIHIYPGCEVAANFGGVPSNPQFALEPDCPVTWNPGDQVEDPHFTVFGGRGLFLGWHQDTPSTSGVRAQGINLVLDGKGINASSYPVHIELPNPDSFYRYGGGPNREPPNLFTAAGAVGDWLHFYNPPHQSYGGENAVVAVNYGGPTADKPFRLFSLYDEWMGQFYNGAVGITYDPGTAVTLFDGPIKGYLYQGPPNAPSGACIQPGWAFSQDGHVTFCNGSTWALKL